MSRIIKRRKFIKQGTVLTAGVIGGLPFMPSILTAKTIPDIYVVHGDQCYDNTVKAINGLGGMSQFVTRGSKVGLLVNHAFLNIGAHVHPDMTVAIARMCFDAGAAEVRLIKSPSMGYFNRASKDHQAKDVIREIKDPSDDYKTIAIKDGIALKEAEVMKELLESDVFINTAIVKNHSETFITAILKNMMGSAPFSTCRKFHDGDDHLAQCIADINLVRKPDLCVVDALKILATGGPIGPGLIKDTRKIYAGRDPLAMDTYGSVLLGLDPKEIKMLEFAAKHELGINDIHQIVFEEIDG